MMNKVKIAVCALLAAVLVLGYMTGCARKLPDWDIAENIMASARRDYQPISAYKNWDIVAENNSLQLLFEQSSCNVAVRDIATDTVWRSNPDDKTLEAVASEDIQNEYRSQLILHQYDSRERLTVVNSYNESVKKQQIEIFSIDNGVMIVYTLGDKNSSLLPEVISQSTAQALKEVFNAEDYERIFGFYDITGLKSMTEELKEEYLKTYPILKDEDIYIIRKVSNRIKEELLGYFIAAKLNAEWVNTEYDKIGMEYIKQNNIYVEVPVEYTLTTDGLRARVLTDKIFTNNNTLKNTSVMLLPYFGCSAKDDTGYMVIPDGSGAKIDLSADSGQLLNFLVYGSDPARITSDNSFMGQPVVLPVFGMQKEGATSANGFFALIESGAEMATIYSLTSGIVYPLDSIYCGFEILPRDSIEYINAKVADKNLYAKRGYNRDLTVSYTVLPKNTAGYISMAEGLREKLFADRTAKKPDKAPVYIDVYGAVERQEQVLNYNVSRTRSLTTFKETEEIIRELEANGVSGIQLRLLNWQGDKYSLTVSDDNKPSEVLGGKKALSELHKILTQRNIPVYMDYDPLLKKENVFGGLKSVLNLNGNKVSVSDKRYILWSKNAFSYSRYALDAENISKQFDKIEKSIFGYGTAGLSLSSAGNLLYSDFNKAGIFNRSDMSAGISSRLKQAADGRELIMDGGNYYTLPYVSHLLSVPTGSSNLYAESANIPLLQMVLHGYTGYAARAMNLSDNPEVDRLKNIEYGCEPYYILTGAEPLMLKNTEYTEMYSTNYSDWIGRIKQVCEESQQLRDAVLGKRMTGHHSPQPGVYITEYENGVYSIVNYNETPVSVNGVRVEGMDFYYEAERGVSIND